MKKKRTSTIVPVRLNDEMLKEITIITLKEGKYRSEVIRDAIAAYIKKWKITDSI